MIRGGTFGPALVAERPFEEMCSVATRLVSEGRERGGLVEELHRLSVALDVEGQPEAGAVVLSVLDRVGGWCTPDRRI